MTATTPHIIYDRALRVTRSTPGEWLPLTAAVAELANTAAKRNDIVAYIGEKAGGGAPACFWPDLAELEVDTTVAFGPAVTPDMFPADFAVSRSAQADFPVFTGLIRHEASHAAHTKWDKEKMARENHPIIVQTAVMLEELRIERLGVLDWPTERQFHRASGIEIMLREIDWNAVLSSGLYGIVGQACLILGRVDAGVLDEEDVTEVEQIFDNLLSQVHPDMLTDMREAWARVFEVEDTDTDGMAAVAKHYLETLARHIPEEMKAAASKASDDGDSSGESGSGSGGTKSGSSSGSGSGSGSSSDEDDSDEGEGESSGSGSSGPSKEELEDAINDLQSALNDAAEETQIDAQDRIDDDVAREAAEQDAEEQREREKERRKKSKTAQQVFGDPSKSSGDDDDDDDKAAAAGDGLGRSSSRVVSSRVPTENDHSIAVTVARQLERAAYRDRRRTQTSTMLPPGKLRGGELVKERAQKARGMVPTAKPWRKKVVQHTDDPTLRVACAVDVSGSMSSAMEPMGVMAWAWSEAVRRIQGTIAMAYFGSGVFSVLKPGQHLKKVKIYNCPDGTDYFDKTFNALDGALELLEGEGARLFVIVSDMAFYHDQKEKAEQIISDCVRAGVAVVILPFDSGFYAKGYEDLGARVITGVLDPVKASEEIGRVAAEAITAAGQRMQVA